MANPLLTLAEFERELVTMHLRLRTQSAMAEEHFDQWCTGYAPAAPPILRIKLPKDFPGPKRFYRINWWS